MKCRTATSRGRVPRSERTRLRWFNTAAFAAPTLLTYGTSVEDAEHSGLATGDLSLIRSFKLPNFGRVTSARLPRTVQLGTKFRF